MEMLVNWVFFVREALIQNGAQKWEQMRIGSSLTRSRFVWVYGNAVNFRETSKFDPFLDQLIYGFLNLCDFKTACKMIVFFFHRLVGHSILRWCILQTAHTHTHSMYISTYGLARNFPVLSSLENARIVDFSLCRGGKRTAPTHNAIWQQQQQKTKRKNNSN